MILTQATLDSTKSETLASMSNERLHELRFAMKKFMYDNGYAYLDDYRKIEFHNCIMLGDEKGNIELDYQHNKKRGMALAEKLDANGYEIYVSDNYGAYAIHLPFTKENLDKLLHR